EAAQAEDGAREGERPDRPGRLEASPDPAIGDRRELLVAEALQREEEPIVVHRSTARPARTCAPDRLSSFRRRSRPRCCRFQIAFSALSSSFATSAAL